MRLRSPSVAANVGFAAAALLAAAQADDSALRVSGGMVQVMDDHPSIRMERASIEADVRAKQSHVRCEFVFVNDGPATAVTMGFPAFRGHNVGGDTEAAPALEGFRSWVDGQSVATRKIVQSMKPERPPDRWYTKRVAFAKGQRRVVRDTYTQPHGEISDGSYFFPYVLTTGASWHGPIGHVAVVVRWSEPHEWIAMIDERTPPKWEIAKEYPIISARSLPW